jgi:hypothetical protein
MTDLAYGKPAVLAHVFNNQTKSKYVFAAGVNGHLFLHHFKQGAWQWKDLGTPPGTSVALDHPEPAGFTCQDDPEGELAFVFVRAVNGHLFMKYSLNAGKNWTWVDLGTPTNTTITGAPSVVTFRNPPEPRRAYVFVRGADGQLYVNYWDGVWWHWAKQGVPSGTTTVSGSPGAVTFKEPNLPQRIYAFVRASDGHLHVNYWDGNSWEWADQGVPPGSTVSNLVDTRGDARIPRVTTYYHDFKQRIYAFVTTADEYLAVNYWNGNQWQWKKWTDLISPPGYPKMNPVLGEAFTFVYLNARWLQVYWVNYASSQLGGDSMLCHHFWDGSQWDLSGNWVANHVPGAVWMDDEKRAHIFLAGPNLQLIDWESEQKILKFDLGTPP